MLLRKKRLEEEAEKLLINYTRSDPYKLGKMLRRRIFEHLVRRGPQKFMEDYSTILNIVNMYPHNSIISLLLIIGETIIDNGVHEELTNKEFAVALKRIFEVIERADGDYLDRSSRALAMELYPDADIFASTGGEILYYSILGSRSKIEIVRAPYLSPYGKGKYLIEKLAEEGVQAVWIRDDMRLTVLERSDFTIFPIYSITTEGMIVTDYAVLPSILISNKLDKPVMAIGSWSSLLAVHSVETLVNVPRVEGLRMYDVIDPDEYSIKLVTDKFVVDITREKLLTIAEEGTKGVKELVRVSTRNVKGYG